MIALCKSSKCLKAAGLGPNVVSGVVKEVKKGTIFCKECNYILVWQVDKKNKNYADSSRSRHLN